MIVIKTFQELSNEELYEILHLRSAVFVVEQKCLYQDIDHKDLNSLHLLLKRDNKMIGYLRIIQDPKNSNEVYIGRVLIASDFRGKGYAVEIMKSAIEYIYNVLHKKKITISAQKYLTAFYESLGFSSVGKEYLEDDILHIQMIHIQM